MYTDEHYHRIAERCLRMAAFCERAQSAASLRQIAADYLEMAEEPDRAEKALDEVKAERATQPLRTNRKTKNPLQFVSANVRSAIQSAFSKIKRAIQATMIVAGGILAGVVVVVAMILAVAPPGTATESGRQIQCVYRQMVGLDWPRDRAGFERSVDSVQKFWSSACTTDQQRFLQGTAD